MAKVTEITVEESRQLVEQVKELEMERIALMGDASDASSRRIDCIGEDIEHIVVRLVRDTQNLPNDGHAKVMAMLDEADIEIDKFEEYLGPLEGSADYENSQQQAT
jgi:hypothetical protein